MNVQSVKMKNKLHFLDWNGKEDKVLCGKPLNKDKFVYWTTIKKHVTCKQCKERLKKCK